MALVPVGPCGHGAWERPVFFFFFFFDKKRPVFFEDEEDKARLGSSRAMKEYSPTWAKTKTKEKTKPAFSIGSDAHHVLNGLSL